MSESGGCLRCFCICSLFIVSGNSNNADIADLLVRLAAAEENLSDLTDSAHAACVTLDTVGSPILDCCISGNVTTPYGDRDRFVCVPRATALLFGLNTITPCEECPAGVTG